MDYPSAAELAAPLKLSAEASQLLKPNLSAKDFLGQLVEHGCFSDAIRVVAQLVPPQHAVWWLTLCAWHASKEEPTADELAALESAVRWIMNPSETNWQDARKKAAGRSLKSPSICAAQAAYLAGAKPDPNHPIREFKRNLSAKLTASGVSLAVARAKKAGVPFDHRCALLLGIQVADGELTWNPEAS